MGGAMGGLLSVPAAMAYAAIIFGPFGPAYLSTGVVSCVTALFVVNLISACFRGPQLLLSSVYSLSAVVLASIASQILEHQSAHGQSSPVDAIAVLFLAVGLSGLLQVGMGLVGMGRITKFVPFPVVSGLRTGAALTIIWTQLPPLLGLPQGSLLRDIALTDVRWPIALTGVVTLIVMTQSRRVSQRLPPGIAAIAVGSASYFALTATGVLQAAQGLVGPVPMSIPSPSYAPALAMLLTDADTLALLWTLLPAILSLALLNTMQTLIGTVTADSLAQTRSSADRELLGQGVGNFASALFGGVPLSGLISITVANHRSGGRTHLSRVTSGLFALAVLLLLGPLLAWLPTIVLVGLLLGLSTMLADLDTLRRLSRGLTTRRLHRKDVQDLAVLCSVMMTMFVLGPIEGVLVGAGASVVTFLLNMTTTNIRRQYRADWIRSNVQRGSSDYNLLVEHGDKIVVIEVAGPLFFGTSDRLATHVDSLVAQGPRTIIVDFSRVFDIDSTASKLLLQTARLSQAKGVQLMFSGLATNPRVEAFMARQPLLEQLAAHQMYGSLNEALAAAEDELLAAHSPPMGGRHPLSPRALEALSPMSDQAVALLSEQLTLATFDTGELICAQGDDSDCLYFLAQGRLQVTVCNHEGLEQQIGVLCPGSIFGEMAFIDEASRSASITTLEPSSCYALSRARLKLVQKTHPDVGRELYLAMLMNLSKRVSILNRASAVFRDL